MFSSENYPSTVALFFAPNRVGFGYYSVVSAPIRDIAWALYVPPAVRSKSAVVYPVG